MLSNDVSQRPGRLGRDAEWDAQASAVCRLAYIVPAARGSRYRTRACIVLAPVPVLKHRGNDSTDR